MIKNNLLNIRLSLGYKKQKDFAAFLGIEQPKYSKLENNKEQPSLQQLFMIANKLKINISQIVYWEEDKE